MRREKDVSPYLKRPLRSLEEVLRQRRERLPVSRRPSAAPGNGNLLLRKLSPARSA